MWTEGVLRQKIAMGSGQGVGGDKDYEEKGWEE